MKRTKRVLESTEEAISNDLSPIRSTSSSSIEMKTSPVSFNIRNSLIFLDEASSSSIKE